MKPNVGESRSIQVGYRSGAGAQRSRDVPEESLMLTGDDNIVDIDFDVQWRVNPAKAEDFVFNLQNPEGTIKSVAESAMREVVGRRQIQAILTTEQSSVAQEVQQIIQKALDSYGAGVLINVVQLQGVSPPAEVRQAFVDVNAAQQDAPRARNEAETYASRVVPEARGRSSQIQQQAEAFKSQATAEATGQAARFREVYESYKLSPAVSRERMFLDTMEKVLGGVNKVIIDQGGTAGAGAAAAGVLPVLPLQEFATPPDRGMPSKGARDERQRASRTGAVARARPRPGAGLCRRLHRRPDPAGPGAAVRRRPHRAEPGRHRQAGPVLQDALRRERRAVREAALLDLDLPVQTVLSPTARTSRSTPSPATRSSTRCASTSR